MIGYKPTSEDINRLKPKDGFLKVSGDRIFTTLQGEGLFSEEGGTAGQPAVFLRLHFCNLSCGWCDTKYTWDKKRSEFWQEPVDWSIEETARRIKEEWAKTSWKEKFGTTGENRLVITGGEPLLQQQKIVQLIKLLLDWNIEIETNGTVSPIDELLNCQINCSPKLENSGNLKSIRFRPDVLRKINSWSKSWFKFVVQKESDLKEVEEIVRECNLSGNKILVMPEGYTLEDVKEHEKNVVGLVKKHGWRIGRRNQLTWFGNKRRT